MMVYRGRDAVLALFRYNNLTTTWTRRRSLPYNSVRCEHTWEATSNIATLSSYDFHGRTMAPPPQLSHEVVVEWLAVLSHLLEGATPSSY